MFRQNFQHHVVQCFHGSQMPQQLPRCKHIAPTLHAIHRRAHIITLREIFRWNQVHCFPAVPVLLQGLLGPIQGGIVFRGRFPEEGDFFSANLSLVRTGGITHDITDGYVEFVLEQLEEAKALCADPLVLIEQRLDFSCYVPDGFGTGDCLIVADKLLHIIDFKYGQGVLVDAEENPQMMLYALGALRQFDHLYDIAQVAMSIYQPRRENVSTWTITVEQLMDWAEQTLKPKAEMAYQGEGDYVPGPWCTFCKAAVKCRARAEAKLQLAKYEFAMPPLLTDAEIEDILSRLPGLTKWAAEIEAYAQDAAIHHGKVWHGFKLVESRTNRKYTDEEAVIRAANAAGYHDIFKKSLIPITEMEKLMGKKTFAEVLGGLVEKPRGRPTLVPVSDRRPAITTMDATQEFTEITEV